MEVTKCKKYMIDTEFATQIMLYPECWYLQRIKDGGYSAYISAMTYAQLVCTFGLIVKYRMAVHNIGILDFCANAAEILGQFQSKYLDEKKKSAYIRAADLTIMAHAKAENLILVSKDPWGLKKSYGVQIEDWTME